MKIDTFFTWEYLLSFAGCVIGTGLLTEFTKPLFKKFPTQLVSYMFAVIIMLVGQLATDNLASWDVAVLDLVNAAVVSLAANGGFDALNRAFGKKTDAETEYKDEGDAE
jgi:hypothetical protein